MTENKEGDTSNVAIAEMRGLYEDLESQFMSFNRIVPYSHNKDDVYSPRLYNILQAACPQVISMMHHISLSLSLHHSTKQHNFPYYYQLLNSKGVLSMQKISTKQNLNKKLRPFHINRNDTPKWWQNYNDSKHNLPEGAYHGNIGNVLNALGALAILHDLGKRVLETSNPREIFNRRKWHVYPTEIINSYYRLNGKSHLYYNCRIFYYLTYISG